MVILQLKTMQWNPAISKGKRPGWYVGPFTTLFRLFHFNTTTMSETSTQGNDMMLTQIITQLIQLWHILQICQRQIGFFSLWYWHVWTERHHVEIKPWGVDFLAPRCWIGEACACCRLFVTDNECRLNGQDLREVRPYQCRHCRKKFSLKHQLDTHHRIHTGE